MKRIKTFVLPVILYALAAAISFNAVSQEAEEKTAPAAEEIVSNVRAAVNKLKSYSYNLRCLNKGDERVQERHKAALKDYEGVLSKIEMVTRKKMGSDPKDMYETISGMQYVKPFHMQVSLDKDDYLPELIQGARTFYDPSVNDLEVFLKEPMIGLVFRNPVAESDSGVVMVINYKFNLLEFDCSIANGATPEFLGMEDYEGRPAYMIEMAMKNDVKPWKMPCGENTYEIPKNAWPQMDRELANLSWRIDKYGEGAIKTWVDAETWLPVRKEIRFGGELFVEHFITDTVLNKVNKKKLLKAKKPKKGLFK